jgi:hypothetical protein
MDIQFVKYFIHQWSLYFQSAELPMIYYYTDQVGEEDSREPGCGPLPDRQPEAGEAGLPICL